MCFIKYSAPGAEAADFRRALAVNDPPLVFPHDTHFPHETLSTYPYVTLRGNCELEIKSVCSSLPSMASKKEFRARIKS
jgi:hypothetical protein